MYNKCNINKGHKVDNKIDQEDEVIKGFGELEPEQNFGSDNAVNESAREEIKTEDSEVSTPQVDITEVKEEVPQDTNVESAATESDTSATASTNTAADKNERKGHGRAVILAVILVLVLIGCVGAYFLLMQKPSDKKDNKTPDDKKKEVSSYRLSGNDLSDFDLRFLQIENKEKNVVYSPLSIKYALAMLKDGADGETKKQIDDLIGDYKAKAYINSKNISLANAMFIRDEFKEQVVDSYIDGLKKNYNAEVVYDSFKTPDTINKWVSDKTLGLINNIMKAEELNELQYALVNALAIDQNWNYQLQCQTAPSNTVPCHKDWNANFNVKYAHEKYTQIVERIPDESSFPALKFNNLENRKSVEIGASFNNYDIFKEIGEDKIRSTVTEEYKKWLASDDGKYAIKDCNDHTGGCEVSPSDVNAVVEKYMKELKENYGSQKISTDFYINDAEDAKVFAKDLKEYDGNTLQYVGIMPKEKDLKTFVNELTADKGKEYINGLKELKNDNFKDGVVTRIDAQIPLFKYNYDLSLKDDLRAMGVKDVFDLGKSDLKNMVKVDKSYIEVAKHGADIEFSNMGIKAGAATIMGGAGGGGSFFEYLWDVPVETIDLTFDKPFLYLIRDKNSGEIWFVGTVYEPIEKVK